MVVHDHQAAGCHCQGPCPLPTPCLSCSSPFPRNRKEGIFTLIWLLLCAYFVDCARYFHKTLSITVREWPPFLPIRKLRLRKVKDLPETTKVAGSRAWIWILNHKLQSPADPLESEPQVLFTQECGSEFRWETGDWQENMVDSFPSRSRASQNTLKLENQRIRCQPEQAKLATCKISVESWRHKF